MTKQGTWAVLYCNTATAAGGTGVGRWAGAGRAWCARAGATGSWASGRAGERGTGARARGAAGTRVCVAGGSRRVTGAHGLAKVVHSVHSACFWPGLTQYFS